MTPQQRKIELEWEKCRKEMWSKLLSKPGGKDLRRVIALTLLTFSIIFNAAQADTIRLMSDKFDEIHEIAEFQNGWVWFDMDNEVPDINPWEPTQ